MVRWFRWLSQHGLLPGFALAVVAVIVLGEDLVAPRPPEQDRQQKPDPTGPTTAPEWQEPFAAPIEELASGRWENCWVVVRGVVTPDGTDGLDWVGISGDGQAMRVLLLFRKRDFRRCRAGQVVTAEGFHRGSDRGMPELIECRFRDGQPADR